MPAFRAHSTLPPQPISQTLFPIFLRVWFRDYYSLSTHLPLPTLVILLASFHSPAVIFEQLSLIYSLPRYLVRSFRLILPIFPTATMERVDKEGQVVTAKVRLSLRYITTYGDR